VRRLVWIAAIAMTIVLIGSIGGAYHYYRSHTDRPLSDAWPQISWRAQIYLKKAFGGIPELSWAELLRMTAEEHGFGLHNVIGSGQSVDATLTSPYTSRQDLEAGGQLFREHCAMCHGPNGRGDLGPSLARSGYRKGDSEVAIYRVLTDGIAGTPMLSQRTNLSFVQRWQVVAYLRTLQLHLDERDESHVLNIHVSSEQIRKANDNPGEWLSYSGSLSGWRYSPLSEITPANVSQLRLRWVHQFTSAREGPNSTFGEPKFETTPLVVGDTIFVTEPPASVIALDAMTGKVIWKYERPIPVDLPIETGRVNRGLAILDDSLFFGSVDGYLIAINASTGKVKWQTRVARSSDGYSLTGAPLVANGRVVIG